MKVHEVVDQHRSGIVWGSSMTILTRLLPSVVVGDIAEHHMALAQSAGPVRARGWLLKEAVASLLRHCIGQYRVYRDVLTALLASVVVMTVVELVSAGTWASGLLNAAPVVIAPVVLLLVRLGGNSKSAPRELRFSDVERCILHNARVSLKPEGGPLLGDQVIYEELTRSLNRLGNGGWGSALCLDKDWDSPCLRPYFEANVNARRRGVKISRVFLGSAQARREAARQRRHGIATFVVNQPEFMTAASVFRLPANVGFVLLGDDQGHGQAFVHWGSGDSAIGYCLTSPVAVLGLRDLFKCLKRRAVPVPDQPFSVQDVGRHEPASRHATAR